VPLAGRHEDTGSTVVRVVLVVAGRVTVRRALPLNQLLEPLRDLLLPLARRVLVDQRRADAAVSHPVHQLASARPRLRGELVAGVPEIMEVEAGR